MHNYPVCTKLSQSITYYIYYTEMFCASMNLSFNSFAFLLSVDFSITACQIYSSGQVEKYVHQSQNAGMI